MECRLYLANAPANAEYAPDEVVDLGRNWEALNYLLTGHRESTRTAASLLVEEWPDIGGSEASEIDAEAFESFALWLGGQADDTILDRFDPRALTTAGIYNAEMLRADPASAREELRQALQSLRAFTARGMKVGGGAIRVIV